MKKKKKKFIYLNAMQFECLDKKYAIKFIEATKVWQYCGLFAAGDSIFFTMVQKISL